MLLEARFSALKDFIKFSPRYEQLADGALQLMDGLYFGGSEPEIRSLMNAGLIEEERIRFFAGYAGWGAGQLERELDEQIWVVTGMRMEYLDAPGGRLWRNVVQNLGRNYSTWLEIPDKASYN